MQCQTFEQSESEDLTVQAVRDLRIVFACFQDTDRAVININQLVDIVELLGDPRPNIADIHAMVTETYFDPTDLNNYENEIDFKKFVRFFVFRLHGKNIKVRTKEIFRALDCDDSGEVSAVEIQESLKSMGLFLNTDEVFAMTTFADTSKGGEINYNQFRQIWRRVDSELADCTMKPQKKQSKADKLFRLVANHGRWKILPPKAPSLAHPERLFTNATVLDEIASPQK